MNRILLLLYIIAFLLSACAAAKNLQPQTDSILPTSSLTATEMDPTLTEPGSKRPKITFTVPVMPTATPKVKSKTPLPAPTSANPEFITSQILGRPTDSSITVNIVPAIDMQLYYEYGTATGEYTSQTELKKAAAGEPVETLIDGLQENTRYYYRLRYNGMGGEESSFITQRAAGSTFTFAIQGDSHPERVKNQFNADLYTKTLLSAAQGAPDFYFAMGDDFSVDTLKEVNLQTVEQLYINQRQWLGLVRAPVFLVNGNHEQAALANTDGTPDNVAVWAQTSRNAYYPQPAPDDFYSGDNETVEAIGLLRDYYAFTWGDALFVVIDPYWHSLVSVDNEYGMERDQKSNRDLWEITLGEMQYQWFRQTIEGSSAKYKFVFAHHVNGTGRGGIEVAKTYEWGDAAQLGVHRPGWEKTIHQIMVDGGVTIFFQGHDHIFARQELDGVIYQTLPEPANPNYGFENAENYLSGDLYPNSGHVRVTVSPDGVTVEYIRSFLDRPDELTFSYTTD